MVEKETKIFRGSGLNSDDDLDFIQSSDARNRYLMGFINGDYDDLVPRKVPEALSLVLPPVLNAFFGLFVGTIQAFVFTMLTVVYISVQVK